MTRQLNPQVFGGEAANVNPPVVAPAHRLPARVLSPIRSEGVVGQAEAHSRVPLAANAAKPLDKRDLMMIITQLSIMTRAGLDLADALRSLAARANKPLVGQALSQVHKALEEGCRLSQALAAQGKRFGGIVVASVAAGEASGQLFEVLSRLRLLLRDDLRTRSAIRSLVSYPIVLTVVTGGVLGAMIFFVLPQFGAIYASSRAPVPLVTQMLLDGASLLQTYWWALAGVAVVIGAAAWRYLRSSSGLRTIDRLCFQLPVLRTMCRSLCMGRIFRLQGVLLESGVPLLEVLELTQDATRSTLLRELNGEMQQAVVTGKKLSSAFENSICLPDGAYEMIATAEANGQLASVMQTVGEFFESEGEQQLRDVVKIAEPVIIVFLGIVIGAIVLSVMLPMLDLSSAGAM